MLSCGACGLRSCCLRIPRSPAKPFLGTPPRSHFLSRRWRFSSTSCSAPAFNGKQKVIVISGPTGAGKSRLALELAKRLNGDIISADCVQVYRALDVGSVKPSLSDRKEVPHHLVDILHPSQEILVDLKLCYICVMARYSNKFALSTLFQIILLDNFLRMQDKLLKTF